MESGFNLFWGTRRLTDRREDHLTEFIAAALISDVDFADAYLRILMGSEVALPLRSVATQREYPRCRPDLVLEFADGLLVACEHKIAAAETIGPETAEKAGQLERYLELPVDKVAYIREDWANVDDEVLRSPKYVRPASGYQHFLWRDFYAALKVGRTPLVRWLRDAFDEIGYKPPHPGIGEISANETLGNRENFKKFWGPTASEANHRGWASHRGSTCELYLENKRTGPVKRVFVTPYTQKGVVLRVRVTAYSLDDVQAAKQGLAKLKALIPYDVQVYDIKKPLHTFVIDVQMDRVVSDATEVGKIESSLARHVIGILDCVS